METLTKERPILMSSSMIQAILSGDKTQTRRMVKPQPDKQMFPVGMGYWSEWPKRLDYPYQKCPYGEIGDVLWCRETWLRSNYVERDEEDNIISSTPSEYYYKASWEGGSRKWKPSIFMPKEACRIRLEITDVRVERLQDISENDAIAEGIKTVDWMHLPTSDPCVCGYSVLWEKINGKGSWRDNPFIWVINFKRI